MSRYNLMSQTEREEFLKILHAAPLDSSGIKQKYLDIAYGDDTMQKMDIYLPHGTDFIVPTIVFTHGGGWSSGSKGDTQVMPFIHCLDHGYAVVSLEFRETPRVHFPENLYDVKAALRFLRKNGSKYLIDPDNIVLAGASAGAHLALMAAYTQNMAPYEGGKLGQSCTIRGVIDQFGVTEFLSRNKQFDESGYARFEDPEDTSPTSMDILMGARCESIKDLLCFAQPIDMVHPNIPPTLIQHGKFDPMVPYQQATKLYERICEVAGPDHSTLCINNDCTHGDPKFGDDERLCEILDFLKKVF